MKVSAFVPEYGSFVKLLLVLHEYSVGYIFNFIEKTKKIDVSIYNSIDSYNIDRIKKDYSISDVIANDLKEFFEKTGTIPSEKNILFAESHNLLCKIEGHKIGKNYNFSHYFLTDLGRKFIDLDLVTLADIDNKEMLLFILDHMSHYAESGDVYMDDFSPILNSSPDYEFTESRANNLVDRKLLNRRYNRTEDCYSYKISKKGLNYLKFFKSMKSGFSYIEKLFLVQNDIEKLKMMDWLYNMNPYQFELLVSMLLGKMGYYDIRVTSKGSDGGIDVVAEIKSGTSIVKEIVQVKRWKSNVQRPTLDQIRGVLGVSKATRCSIITTSNFSQGCYDSLRENDSVTLINGESLIDMLLKYKLGFSEKHLRFYEFKPPVEFCDIQA